MTNVTDLHPGKPEARARLMERIPAPTSPVDRAALIADLPMILSSALDLILEDFEALPGMTKSSAVGCRIIAAVIDRLQD